MKKKNVKSIKIYHPYLGERIVYLRERAGLSQADLTRACGTSKGFFSLVESGQSGISMKNLKIVADLLNCDTQTLANHHNIAHEDLDIVDKLHRQGGHAMTDEKENALVILLHEIECVCRKGEQSDDPRDVQSLIGIAKKLARDAINELTEEEQTDDR